MIWLHVTENFFIWNKLQLVLNVAACLLGGQAGMNVASQISSEKWFKFSVLAVIFKAYHDVSGWDCSKEYLPFPNRTSPKKHTGVNSCEWTVGFTIFAVFPGVWLSVSWQTDQFVSTGLVLHQAQSYSTWLRHDLHMGRTQLVSLCKISHWSIISCWNLFIFKKL